MLQCCVVSEVELVGIFGPKFVAAFCFPCRNFESRSVDKGVQWVPLIPGPDIFRGPGFLETLRVILAIN